MCYRRTEFTASTNDRAEMLERSSLARVPWRQGGCLMCLLGRPILRECYYSRKVRHVDVRYVFEVESLEIHQVDSAFLLRVSFAL